MELPLDIRNAIYEMVGVLSDDVDSVWLLGSRANGTATEISDWDFLIFSNREGLERLKVERDRRIDNIDLLVVFDGENFIDPWPEDEESAKSGSLSVWKWRLKDSKTATYQIVKYLSDEWFKSGQAITKELIALKVWPV